MGLQPATCVKLINPQITALILDIAKGLQTPQVQALTRTTKHNVACFSAHQRAAQRAQIAQIDVTLTGFSTGQLGHIYPQRLVDPADALLSQHDGRPCALGTQISLAITVRVDATASLQIEQIAFSLTSAEQLSQ